jgi:hypothetical protein
MVKTTNQFSLTHNWEYLMSLGNTKNEEKHRETKDLDRSRGVEH